MGDSDQDSAQDLPDGVILPDLEALQQAKLKAQQQMLAETSPQTLAAYNQASKMLDQCMSGQQDVVFKNRKEALGYLQSQGFKVKQTKIYTDGLLRVQADGTVLEKDIRRYIKLAKLRKDSGDDKLIEMSRKTKQLEIEKLDEQVRDLRSKREREESNWLPRSDLELEIAARLVVLETGLRSGLHSELSSWVHTHEIDTRKIPLLLERVNDVLDEILNGFASMERFQVIFENEEKVEG